MNYYGPTIVGPDLLFGDVLYTRPDTDPVQPEDRAEVADPLERDRLAIGTAGYPHYCEGMPALSMSERRRFRALPIIEFVYHVVIDPILAGGRTLTVVTDDGEDAPARRIVPGLPGVNVQEGPEDKRKRLSESLFKGLWPDIFAALECLNYGFWLSEVTWDRVRGVVAPTRFNSFRPWEITLIPDKFNDFAGFKLNDEERDARYAFHCINEEHRVPLLGHSRLESAFASAWRIVKSHENGDRIEKKASGIQMMIGIMSGMSFKDADGNTVSPEKAVQTVKDAATSGKTWTRPLFAFDKDDVARNPALANVPSMQVDKFDWGETGPSLLAGIERRRELAVEIIRAYHRPEREAMEGQFGTKAEAGVHGQVGITDSELVHGDVLCQFNEQVFNRYLVTNWGPDYAGRMYWKPNPMADPQRELYEKLLEQLMANPVTGAAYEAHIDRRAFMQKSEFPLKPEDEVVEPPPMLPEPTAEEGNAGSGVPGGAMEGGGTNGNGRLGRMGLSADPFDDGLLSLNCGTGAGGFKQGNKCQKGGGGTATATVEFEQKRLSPDSEEFKEWFGDSKVVDEDGKPLVVYHGVRNPDMRIEDGEVVFTPKFLKFNPAGKTEPGIWFSPDPSVAAMHGTPVAFYLKASKPLQDESPLKGKPEGHDAVYRMRSKLQPSVAKAWEIAVFDPEQIRLAKPPRKAK